MAAHGKLEQYHGSYEEHLQQYFVVNNIKDAKKLFCLVRVGKAPTR